jgi:hypothetical protein
MCGSLRLLSKLNTTNRVLAILRRQPRVAGREFIFGEGEHGTNFAK